MLLKKTTLKLFIGVEGLLHIFGVTGYLDHGLTLSLNSIKILRISQNQGLFAFSSLNLFLFKVGVFVQV